MTLIALLGLRANADVCCMENVGTEWQPSRQHKDIRLLKSYDVVNLVGNLDLSTPDSFAYADVTMSVNLKNEGPSQAVVIGFPEIVRAKSAADKPISGLRVLVNNKPVVPVRVNSSGLFSYYWTFKTVMGKGKTQSVTVKYRSMLDKDYKGYAYRNAIQLTSSWKGTVKEARLVVDITRVKGYKPPIVLFPSPQFQKGRQIIWVLNNVKPTSVNNMYASFESKGRAPVVSPNPDSAGDRASP